MARSYRNEPRVITVKFDGICACCGAPIKKGQTASFYPAKHQIAHVGGLEGNSATCTANIRASYVRDPGEDAADRWNEAHGDKF